MAAFDFENFFRNNGIEYRDSGSGIKKGNLACNCPFCAEDSKQFMGVDPRTGYFGCWWSSEHRGRNPATLVKALLRCTWAEAKRITGGGDDLAPQPGTLEELEKKVEALDQKPLKSIGGFRIQTFPPEFRPITPTGISAVCWEHLADVRKFRERDINCLCADYKLRYAPTGQFKKRIILPFLHKNNVVIGWQARALGDARVRYLSDPPAIANKRVLFNHGPAMEGGEVLVIVEGPLDACKTDFYGKRKGIRAVGTVGTSFTEWQVGLLFKLCPLYRRVVILFDPGALQPAFSLKERLSRFDPIIGQVPDGVEDPGAFEPRDVVPFIKGIL